MAEVWKVVPTLTTTEAEVAATTGVSASTAGAALRQLAAHGHLEKVPYLSETSNGRPCARIGYRLPETTS